MKAKHAVFLIACGFCLEFVGSYLKVIHRHGASQLLFVALLLKVGGVVLLTWKAIQYAGFRKFLDQ